MAADLQCFLLSKVQNIQNGCRSAVFFAFKGAKHTKRLRICSVFCFQKCKTCKTAADLQCFLLSKVQNIQNGCGSAVFFAFICATHAKLLRICSVFCFQFSTTSKTAAILQCSFCVFYTSFSPHQTNLPLVFPLPLVT